MFGGLTLFAAGVGVGLMWDEKQLHDPVTQSIEATDVEEHVRAQSSSEAREPQSAAPFSEAEGSSNSSNEVEPTLADASHEQAPLTSSALNTLNNDRTETVEREPAVQTAMPAQPSADAGAPFHTQITEAPRSREGQPVLEPQSPFIPPLALNPIGISGDHNSAEPFLQHMNRNMPAHARHFAIRAFGGLTLSQFQYRTEDLRAFSNRFHTASSGGGGFAFDFEYKDQDWSVGLGWLDFAQRLEFEHTWQTEFTDPNGIVSVEIDQISGDTIAMETGPLLVTATHHRHVRDFNHISAIVIPMEWRKQVLFSSWTLGTGVGGQFLIRTGASGQSFVAEGTLARFDDADLPRQTDVVVANSACLRRVSIFAGMAIGLFCGSRFSANGQHESRRLGQPPAHPVGRSAPYPSDCRRNHALFSGVSKGGKSVTGWFSEKQRAQAGEQMQKTQVIPE